MVDKFSDYVINEPLTRVLRARSRLPSSSTLLVLIGVRIIV